ncbi:ABC transporter substrate-binding protein [Polaromonas sp. LjRoot131]|uniref:ABC transporter substrate-binding protein n=1 Tax=Polaromonas sp. LjRoot131 TaxID=3342262 RepID=UPI003ECC98F9
MRNRCLSSAFAKILMALTLGGFVMGVGPTLAAEIVVGQVGPMSGSEAGQGRAYAAGMQLHFNALNKAGGINGHKFTLLRKDDGGRPDDTVALTKQMLAEDRPLVLAGYFGGKNVTDLVSTGVLSKEKIALVGYRTSEIQPDTPYLYSVRAGLRDEITKLIEHLATVGITRLGLFHEAGPGSTALIAAAESAAKKAKANIEGRASYVANTVSVTDAVDTFMNMQPQAIIMISSGAAAAGFIEKYRIAGGAAQLLAHSGADIEQLSKRLSSEQMQGVAIAQVTPSPYKVSSQLVKEFADTVAKTPNLDVPVSYAMMEGYIAARVITEAIRRQGSKPSREGTVLALDGMSSFDVGGYLISFKPGQHSGSNFVELSIVSIAGRIRQ